MPNAGPAVQAYAGDRQDRIRQTVVVLALLGVVVVLDQAAKWWAWRHFAWTRINSGGDVLVGRTVGAWYADPVLGALLDLLDVGLLSMAVSVLVRRRWPAAVTVLGALMIGGWGSNLLDRLGMHYVSAPGSVRGVVDFIHVGAYYYNVADLFIIGCTPPFLLAAGYLGVRTALRGTPSWAVPPSRSALRARARVIALAGAGLIVVVALGAANYGGVSAARPARAAARGRADAVLRVLSHTRAQTRTIRTVSIPVTGSRRLGGTAAQCTA